MRKAKKMNMSQKMEKEKKGNPKIEDSSKVKTHLYCYSTCDFPLDYPNKNYLRLAMMFIVEAGNRNPHVKKHDSRQRAKIICNARAVIRPQARRHCL